MVTLLIDALRTLGLDAEVGLGGRWLTVLGQRCPVYVVQATVEGRYYTWCDDPEERAVEVYRDPREAIAAGLRRATRRGMERPDIG